MPVTMFTGGRVSGYRPQQYRHRRPTGPSRMGLLRLSSIRTPSLKRSAFFRHGPLPNLTTRCSMHFGGFMLNLDDYRTQLSNSRQIFHHPRHFGTVSVVYSKLLRWLATVALLVQFPRKPVIAFNIFVSR